jgi:hypothetical protein
MPDAPGPADLVRIVDLAFDYRGDVTLVLADGSRRTGYVGNRDAATPDPYLELLVPGTPRPVRVRYAELRTIHFTGRDAASGKSYAARPERRAGAGEPGARP